MRTREGRLPRQWPYRTRPDADVAPPSHTVPTGIQNRTTYSAATQLQPHTLLEGPIHDQVCPRQQFRNHPHCRSAGTAKVCRQCLTQIGGTWDLCTSMERFELRVPGHGPTMLLCDAEPDSDCGPEGPSCLTESVSRPVPGSSRMHILLRAKSKRRVPKFSFGGHKTTEQTEYSHSLMSILLVFAESPQT